MTTKIDELVGQAAGLLRDQQALTDEGAVAMLGRLVREAYEAGQELAAAQATYQCGRSRYCSSPRSRNCSGPGLCLVLRGVPLPGERDTPGPFVRPVAGAVHEYLVAGVDEPVEQRLGHDRVGEQRVPVGGCPV